MRIVYRAPRGDLADLALTFVIGLAVYLAFVLFIIWTSH